MKKYFRIALFFLSFSCFCQTTNSKFLNLKINTPYNEDKSEKIFPIEWNENWFFEKSPFEYNHKLARAACFFSDMAYSIFGENSENNYIVSNFKTLGVKEDDIELHYDVDYSNSLWGNNQCAFSFASKTISSSTAGGKKTLIFIVIRGTPLNANEWTSNLNIDDTNKTEEIVHKGFALAMNVVHSALLSYIIRHKIDPENSCLLITGHSRGAAVSNLLSVQLLDDNLFNAENIYTYTFATPNTTTDKFSSDEKYGNIWNIVNAEDVVPTVPLNRGNWHYTKYGNTLTITNYCNTDQSIYENDYLQRVNEIFNKFNKRDYVPFRSGPFVPAMITEFLSRTISDVDKFYNGGLGLYNKGSFLFSKIFPESSEEFFELEEELTEKKKKKSSSFKEYLLNYLDKKTDGLATNLPLAFADMHSCDTYYSFLAALEEDEIYKTLGYSIIVIKGLQETTVFNTDLEPLCKIIDGKLHYLQTKHPLMTISYFGGRVCIGMPSNMNFDFFISNEALIATPSNVKIENFDVAGVYLGESDVEKIYTRLGKAITFKVGENTLGKYSFDDINIFEVKTKERRKLIELAQLYPSYQFFFGHELFFGMNFFENEIDYLDFGYGLRFGIPMVYGTVIFSRTFADLEKDWNILVGVGSRISLYRSLALDLEFMPKITLGKEQFYFSTVLRPALSMQVLGKTRIALGSTLTFFPESRKFIPGVFVSLRR